MRRPIFTIALALCSLVAGGCRRPHERRSRGPSAATVKLARDHQFTKDGRVQVWEIPLRHELVLPRPTVARQEPPAVKRLREQLAKHTVLRSRILLHPKRLVWELPEIAMPGGGAEPLHLVLKPGSPVAALVNHKQRRFRADTPARIAAWVEGALQPVGTAKRLEVLGDHLDDSGTRQFRGLLVLDRGSTGGRRTPHRYEIVARSRPWATDVGRRARLLWDFLLLPVLRATGDPRLDALRLAGHWPVQLDWQPTAALRSAGAGLRLRLRLEIDARRTRQVPNRWLQLPPTGYRREFGPLVFKHGRRMLHRPTRGLRPRRAGEPRSGPLRIQNPHRRTLLVYTDGLLLGWVGPRAEASWKLLPAGYFRLAAHSLLGTRLWGPQDDYVPGTVSLR